VSFELVVDQSCLTDVGRGPHKQLMKVNFLYLSVGLYPNSMPLVEEQERIDSFFMSMAGLVH